MHVVVQYLAQLKQAAGVSTEQVELNAPCFIREFLIGLARRRGGALGSLLLTADGGLQPTLLVFMDDNQVLPNGNVGVHDGAVITVLTPIAGG